MGLGAAVDRGADVAWGAGVDRGALGWLEAGDPSVVVGSDEVVVGSSVVDVVDEVEEGADRPVATLVAAVPCAATATPPPARSRATAAAIPRLVFRLPFTLVKIGRNGAPLYVRTASTSVLLGSG